jgi:hypothetical protein
MKKGKERKGLGIRCVYCEKELQELVPIKYNDDTVVGFMFGRPAVYCSQECHDKMIKKYKNN